MFSRSIFKMFLFAAILLAAVASASAAAPANEEAQSSAGSIHTYLMPDLSLKSVFTVPLAPQAEANAGPPKLKGACRCSCAINNCNTDADCGPGGLCLAAPSRTAHGIARRLWHLSPAGDWAAADPAAAESTFRNVASIRGL